MELHNSILKDEIDFLSEVYFKELNFSYDSTGDTTVEVVIHPSTCDDVDKQFIRLIINFICSSEYPRAPPLVSIFQPRGLGEEEILDLKRDIESLAKDKINEPMLYDLILYAKEVVTNQNLPHTVCSICLETFIKESDIYKTPQFHFFHNQCIANYVAFEIARHEKQINELLENDKFARDMPQLQILCPYCRQEDVEYDSDFIDKFNIPFETVEVQISEEWRSKAAEMKKRLEQQLERTEANRLAEATAAVSASSATANESPPKREEKGRGRGERRDHQRGGGQRYRGRGRGRGSDRSWSGRQQRDRQVSQREVHQGPEGRILK